MHADRPHSHAGCVRFLKEVLPRLGYRWSGYRRVHRTVCKRLARRIRELGLADVHAYRAHLEEDPSEWTRLDALCRITISRFGRDCEVFEALAGDVLPTLVRDAMADGRTTVRAWSCGCASGEEPYSLKIAWIMAAEADVLGGPPGQALIRPTILATDDDPAVLRRAARGCYAGGSLRELPLSWRERGFVRTGALWCLRSDCRQGVVFRQQDLRRSLPGGPFDLILCRNLVLTYFAGSLQETIVGRLIDRLRPGGFFVIGRQERLPEAAWPLDPWAGAPGIFRRRRAARQAGLGGEKGW